MLISIRNYYDKLSPGDLISAKSGSTERIFLVIKDVDDNYSLLNLATFEEEKGMSEFHKSFLRGDYMIIERESDLALCRKWELENGKK